MVEYQGTNARIVQTTIIDGKQINCVFIFDYYGVQQYQKDFEDFFRYQQRKGITGPSDLDFKLYKIPQQPQIPYSAFREYAAILLSKVLFYLFKQDPAAIPNPYNLELEIRYGQDRDYYFKYFPSSGKQTENTAHYRIAGVWLLQTIVAPYVYFKKVDYGIIARFIPHELTHHEDNARGYFAREDGKTKEVRKTAQKIDAPAIEYLYNAFKELRFEGFADFNSRKIAGRLTIDTVGSQYTYYNNLILLCKKTTRKEARDFFDDAISSGNMTDSGGYAAGRMMCTIILLAEIKQLQKQGMHVSCDIVTDQARSFAMITDFGKFLAKNPKLVVTNVSQEAIGATTARIQKTDETMFMREYEKACDTLGIADSERIMTARKYGILINTAKFEAQKRTGLITSKDYFKKN